MPREPPTADSALAAESVTVAIPVRNGGEFLSKVLDSVRTQILRRPARVEILVCDSGSTDGSPERARRAGCQVITIPSGQFSHGGTRNLLMSRASGAYVAFLTQDALPATPTWLAHLLKGFEVAPDVALTFGPYIPRPDAPLPVRRELEHWFGSLAAGGAPRIDRLAPTERQASPARLYGSRTYFTDANGCVRRSVWEEVPFREVPYAEDHALALDMLRGGYAKVFVPDAAVEHSHDYDYWGWLRRSFDERRGVQQIYELDRGIRLRELLCLVRGGVGSDLRYRQDSAAAMGLPYGKLVSSSIRYHAARALGSGLAAHSDGMPAWLVRRLSLEGRRT